MKINVKGKNPLRLFFGIKYNGKRYRKVRESRIGDIALSTKTDKWTTKGKYYLIVECYAPTGFKGIIGDDGQPCGVHDQLGSFEYFRTDNSSYLKSKSFYKEDDLIKWNEDNREEIVEINYSITAEGRALGQFVVIYQ